MDRPAPIAKPESKTHTLRSWLYIGIIVVVAALTAFVIWWAADVTIEKNLVPLEKQQPTVVAPPKKSTESPQLTTETVVAGREHVWEIAFLPTKEMLFTERKGILSMLQDGQVRQVAAIGDVLAKGEGGLLGLAVDPEFAKNHFIYTCYDSKSLDVRVVRWMLKTDLSGLEDQTAIVTGIPANSTGRHSGCRLAFGPDGYLWVGTGDAAKGDTGIQPKSLGGKVLRVDRAGQAAPNNVGGEYDSRVYSYGHRNVQGIAFFAHETNGVLGVSIEHGSSVDDEMNALAKGNFGWAPPARGYEEAGVPMTDKTRFPDAVEALWKSGDPTQAPSGATILSGRQWKAWDGAVAIAMLKATHLKILVLDKLTITKEERVLEGAFGRLRTAVEGPDGNLYISTDNGGDDKIVRLIPH